MLLAVTHSRLATCSVGQVDVRSINRIPVDGLVVTGAVGDVVVVANANTSLSVEAAQSLLGSVIVATSNVYEIIGVGATSALGSVTVAENARPTFDGVFAIGVVGAVGITTVVFNYNAVASLYDRRRTVFVDRRSSSKDRTVAVAAQDRTVYINKKTSSSDRSAMVA